MMYNEATQPGSSRPNADVFRADVPSGTGGIIFPGLRRMLSSLPALGDISIDVPVSVVMRGPRGSDGDTSERYNASIQRRGDLSSPSVVTSVFSATPIGNAMTLARDIPAMPYRPLLPPGLAERVVDALPVGMKARAANWSRLLARLASKRPTLPVSRE